MKNDLPRSAGVLLALSSLPSQYGIGDLGPSAYQWVDLLAENHQSYWQLLPVGIFDEYACPYASLSAFGGHPLYLSLDLLKDQGLLEQKDLERARMPCEDKINLSEVIKLKTQALKKASANFYKDGGKAEDLIVESSQYWLESFVQYFQGKLDGDAREHLFWQYSFHQQWNDLKSYARNKKVKLFGDLPIFVGHTGLDTQSFSENFKLTDEKRPSVVTGAPPDYFSPLGQIWNTPNYNWNYLAQTNFKWWVERMRYHQQLFNLIRIDHFIGLINVWEIPTDAPDASSGKWVESRGRELLESIKKDCPDIKLVAEDLGELSDKVHQLRDDFSIPSMRVLQFAFGDEKEEDSKTNIHLPENIHENSVYYTGTHDNRTTQQWLSELTAIESKRLKDNHIPATPEGIIKALFESRANLVITPAQDVLHLGMDSRMNIPGTLKDNWIWRLRPEQMNDQKWGSLKNLSIETGRKP